MVWGDEGLSPKSESRTLFGAGLGHSFSLYFPARVRRLMTQKSHNGCFPCVELSANLYTNVREYPPLLYLDFSLYHGPAQSIMEIILLLSGRGMRQ